MRSWKKIREWPQLIVEVNFYDSLMPDTTYRVWTYYDKHLVVSVHTHTQWRVDASVAMIRVYIIHGDGWSRLCFHGTTINQASTLFAKRVQWSTADNPYSDCSHLTLILHWGVRWSAGGSTDWSVVSGHWWVDIMGELGLDKFGDGQSLSVRWLQLFIWLRIFCCGGNGALAGRCPQYVGIGSVRIRLRVRVSGHNQSWIAIKRYNYALISAFPRTSLSKVSVQVLEWAFTILTYHIDDGPY